MLYRVTCRQIKNTEVENNTLLAAEYFATLYNRNVRLQVTSWLPTRRFI